MIFSHLLRTDFEDLADEPMTSGRLAGLFGGGSMTTSGAKVTPSGSWKTITVFRSIQLVSEAVAGLPLKAYSDAGDEGRKRVHPAILKNPHPDMTPFEFWRLVMAHRLTWGNYYALKRRNANGAIVRLDTLAPDLVTVSKSSRYATEGNPSGKYFSAPTFSGGYSELSPFDVLHIPGLGYNGLVGQSPLGMAREAIGAAQSTERLASSFFGSGMRLSGLIKHEKPLKEAEAERVRARMSQLLRSNSDHDVGILDGGAEFERLSIPPNDAQFLETRVHQNSEIATLFGLDPGMLGLESRGQVYGSGVDAISRGFVRFTLLGHLKNIEGRVTKELLAAPSRYAEFDTAGFERGDLKGRVSAYRQSIQAGILTPNEARKLENREALEGLDVSLFPANMLAVDKAGEYLSLGKHEGTTADGTGDPEGGRPPADESSDIPPSPTPPE